MLVESISVSGAGSPASKPGLNLTRERICSIKSQMKTITVSLFLLLLPTAHPIFAAGQGVALDTAHFSSQGVYPIIGQGTSMLPLYHAGQVLLVSPESYSALRIGQDVVYVHNGHLVYHRIIGRCWRGFIVKGINNPKWDEDYVTPENYKGIVRN